MQYILVLGMKLIPLTAYSKEYVPDSILQSRLDRASELYKQYTEQNIETNIIVSGGKDTEHPISRAGAMEHYLTTTMGIPKSDIIIEEYAMNTIENINNTMQILLIRDALYKRSGSDTVTYDKRSGSDTVTYDKRSGSDTVTYDKRSGSDTVTYDKRSGSDTFDKSSNNLTIITSDYHLARVKIICNHYFNSWHLPITFEETKDIISFYEYKNLIQKENEAINQLEKMIDNEKSS